MIANLSKVLLKQEIDRLDDQYLELVYKILRQFPVTPIPPCAQPKSFAEALHTLRQQIKTENIEIDMQVFENDRTVDKNREII